MKSTNGGFLSTNGGVVSKKCHSSKKIAVKDFCIKMMLIFVL
jgi:hypothetical protein